MISIKKITTIFGLFLLAFCAYSVFFSVKPVAADNCTANQNCTNEFEVIVKVSIHQGYPQGTLISNPTLQQAPSSNTVSVIDNTTNETLHKTTVVASQIDGQYVEYILTIAPFSLTNSEETDYVPNSDGGNQSFEVCSDMSSNSGFLASPTCSSPIVPTVQQYSNPSTPISVTVPVDVGITNPSVGDNKYQPGCYSSSSSSTPITCPAGATDSNGKALSPTTNCYVSPSGPTTNGQPLPWVEVSCADLTTPITQPASASTSASATAPASGVCQPGGINLSWFLCPIINGITSAEQDIEGVITTLLKTNPINLSNSNCNDSSSNSDGGDCIFKAWSGLRDYGDILLVIAVLVAVLVEAFGGGVAEAYTVKRMLPRILIAAILINLSIYFVAGLEDMTNIIGQGLFSILHDAFYVGVPWSLKPNGFSSDLTFSAIGLGIFALTSAEALSFFFIFVLMPALFAVVAVLFTLILRQGLLILLVITSPIAFALFCLPNTEQYFRKWWDLLFKTLMVYPIMMAIFAIGDIAYVIMTFVAKNIGPSWIAGMIPIIALLAPLFLMPFAFKFAGGAIGQIHEGLHGLGRRAHEAYKGNVNDPLSRRNIASRGVKDKMLRGREKAVNRGINMQRSGGVVRRRMGGVLAGVTGGANYEMARSRMNKEAMDLMLMQSQTGGDNLIRGIFAKKLNYRDDRGNVRQGWFGTDAEVGADGLVAGQNTPKFTDYEVGKARQFYGKSASMYQSALNYEMGKVGDDQEYGELLQRNIENFNSWGSPLKQDAGSIQLGAGFAQQSSRKEGKHLKLKQATRAGVDANGQTYQKGDMYYGIDHSAFARDMAENVGNYPLANMKTSTPAQLRDTHSWAQSVVRGGVGGVDRDGTRIDQNTFNEAQRAISDLQLTAQSLDNNRFSQPGGGPEDLAGEEGAAAAAARAAQRAGGTQRRISTGAPGKVDDQINTFVEEVLGPIQGNGDRLVTPASRAAGSNLRDDRQGLGGR